MITDPHCGLYCCGLHIPVTEYVMDMEDDRHPLSAAYGCLNAVVLSVIFWLVVLVGVLAMQRM